MSKQKGFSFAACMSKKREIKQKPFGRRTGKVKKYYSLRYPKPADIEYSEEVYDRLIAEYNARQCQIKSLQEQQWQAYADLALLRKNKSKADVENGTKLDRKCDHCGTPDYMHYDLRHRLVFNGKTIMNKSEY
jgi:hypothetical protein